MIREENTLSVSGSVSSWLERDGAVKGQSCRSNVIAFAAADVMAQLAAGLSAAPDTVGLIYGPSDTPEEIIDEYTPAVPLVNPSLTRDHTWEAISEQVEAIGGNVALMPITLTPSVSSSGDDYTSNVATFSANTGAIQGYGFSGGSFCGAVDTLDPVYFYQAVLLSGVPGAYRVFARTTLMDSGLYKSKPDNYDLVVQWAITFK